MLGLTLGDTFPNLEVETTHGNMKLHDSWTILFSHPGDFTPVCTTELTKMASYSNEFERRGVKLLGLSCDDVGSHKEWTKDIEAFVVTYPIAEQAIAEGAEHGGSQTRTLRGSKYPLVPSTPSVLIRRLSFLYPACTGRNMYEVLRVLDSLQRACKHKITTPVNWKPGDAVVISPSVYDKQAKELFPQGFKTVLLPSKKEYLRFTYID